MQSQKFWMDEKLLSLSHVLIRAAVVDHFLAAHAGSLLTINT
jgi:hypothetical protein